MLTSPLISTHRSNLALFLDKYRWILLSVFVCSDSEDENLFQIIPEAGTFSSVGISSTKTPSLGFVTILLSGMELLSISL